MRRTIIKSPNTLCSGEGLSASIRVGRRSASCRTFKNHFVEDAL